MKKMSPFQLIILGVFFVLAIAGVISFALSDEGTVETESIGAVIVWGTIENIIFREQIKTLGSINRVAGKAVQYVEKDPRTYREELVEAFATGAGPDLFFLSQDQIVKQKNKIFITPFESFSERRFKDAFIEEAELFLDPSGIIAFPYVVDPVVMYWNRDILSREGISVPPQFWDEFVTLSPRITKRDQGSNILRATVALGEHNNIEHAKDILVTLILQTGNPIVEKSRGGLTSVLGKNLGFTVNPTQAALRFYTEFSNPVKSAYSWNRSLPNARQSFLAGDLAMYFGFASELPELRKANPNLNFDIALMPQAREDGLKATFSNIQGLAIANTARNKGGAFLVAVLLAGDQVQSEILDLYGLPPAARRVLNRPPSDAVGPILFDSAIISRGWLDTDSNTTDLVFKEMIESVTSGRKKINQAVSNASRELGELYITR